MIRRFLHRLARVIQGRKSVTASAATATATFAQTSNSAGWSVVELTGSHTITAAAKGQTVTFLVTPEQHQRGSSSECGL